MRTIEFYNYGHSISICEYENGILKWELYFHDMYGNNPILFCVDK